MTRELIERNWAAMEAFKAGKPIQWRADGAWRDFTGASPDFEDVTLEWRVKPEPREVWINEYPEALCYVASYRTRQDADAGGGPKRIRAVRFVEVVE